MPPLKFVDASQIKMPLQAHWATQDAFFGIEGVDALVAKFGQAGMNYETHRYLAQHAFANETAQGPGRLPQTQTQTQYDIAWNRPMRFFGQHLG